MSYADKVFIDMCQDILDHGYSTEGEKVRPKWEDGTYAYTIKRFGVVNRYDLSKEFPALTLRRTAFKSAVDEVLWIWQKKSNNIHDLKSHIWDEWADEDGSIGKAYGYQLGVKHQYKEGMMDQVDRVLYDLKENPYSRRIMTNIYVHEDLHEMNLYPCAYSMTFNVTDDKLNAVLNQRSQDVLAANNWNVVQYAVLLHMIAQVSGLKAGELVHVIADAHIYDRHIPLIKELISREPLPAPTFWINPEIKNFYDFTTDDVRLDNYQTGPQITNIPIAVQEDEHMNIIVAVDKNWGIGYQGQLLEHIPEDLKYFKKLTQYNVVVMGRNTWESLPKKDSLPRLPNRINIIISNSMVSNGVMSILGDLTVAMSLEAALNYICTSDRICGTDIFVIGGGQIYNALLPYCNRVYVTKIDKSHDNIDTFFPNLDETGEWEAIEDGPMASYNNVNYQFWHYDRIS